MAVNAVAKVAVSLKLGNGRTICLHENDIVKGLHYIEGDETLTIDGTIRVLNALTRQRSKPNGEHYCSPEPYISSLLNITSLIIDNSTPFYAKLKQIPITSIIDIDEILENGNSIKVGNSNQYLPLSEVIDSAPEGSTIELLNGIYESNININKSIKLISTSGAIVRGSISIGNTTEPIEVSLDGLYLTGNSTITLENVDTFSMQHCIYTNHNFTETKTIPIMINRNDKTPIKINMDNNVFCAENNNCYNIIEVYGPIKSGSSFNHNIFEKECCTHNQINLYDLDIGANISINNNYCEMSANMVRFGFVGSPDGVIEMRNNHYIETDTKNSQYAGLFLVQPYGKETKTMADLKIIVSNTKKPNDQLCYLYAGENDMQFTDTNKPTIIVNGNKYNPYVYN